MTEQDVEQEKGITITSNEELDVVEPEQDLETLVAEEAPLTMLESDAELIARIQTAVDDAPENSQLRANALNLLHQIKTSRNMQFLIADTYKAKVKRFLKEPKYAANIRKQATQRLGSTKKFAFPPLSSLNSARTVFEDGSKSKQGKIFDAAFFVVVESQPTAVTASALSRILFSCSHLKKSEFGETDAGIVISNGIKDVVKFYSN